MLKYITLLCFLLLSNFFTYAQSTGKLSGRVVDNMGNAIDGATVSLLSAKDSILVKADFSNKEGGIEMEGIKQGKYLLRITNTGYGKYFSSPFSIDDKNNDIRLNNITLTISTAAMGEVTVVSQKPFIERKLDRMVVNVENSIVAAGNSVLEVLERSPGVVVNQESSINIKGKSGVIVMIDGKPSPLSGADLITYLRGIPASTIQSIEIITSPSARYDAAGNAGIINIKFKKDQRQGLNGSLALSYGQGRYAKPNASINLNFRKKNWNIFGSHSYSQPQLFTRFYINRKFFDADRKPVSIFDQTSFIKQPIMSNNSRVGVDYYMGKQTIIGAMFNFNWNKNERDGSTNSVITYPDGEIDYLTKTAIQLNEKRFNGFGNFNIKHSFDSSGRELTADIDFGRFRATTRQDVFNQNVNKDDVLLNDNRLNTDQRGLITVKSLKADYIHPFSKTLKLEAGIKSSLVETDAEVNFYDVVNGNAEFDPERSNHFLYKENVNAAYAMLAKEFTKTDIQAGLRMEHTSTRGDQITTGEHFSRSYVNWFPSLTVNQKLSDQHQLSVSYTRRIDRPSYRQLNPFRIFVDPYTYVVGDPALKPVFTNAYELSHTFKGKYITTLNFSRSKDVITDVFVQDDNTRISYQAPANLQDFYIVSLGTFIPVTIKKWMNASLSVNMFWNKYESPFQGGNLTNDFFSWDARLNSSFRMGDKGWSAELNGFYQAKNAWGLFVIRNIAQASVGIQKLSKNRNSTFKLALTDVFYTNRVAVVVNYQNMDFFTDRTWDSRVLTLSFTHRFGKNTVTKARQRTTGVEDEKRRAG
ncbi:TonB-dependent receptor domain-containing protein [Terrimonas rubra]|uniref:TonB-dependent receptor domain-containing protein n=1 Tax=Terrimonas rubra TaxID=1035890 RepID=A0ABW6A1M7_9BACT